MCVCTYVCILSGCLAENVRIPTITAGFAFHEALRLGRRSQSVVTLGKGSKTVPPIDPSLLIEIG